MARALLGFPYGVAAGLRSWAFKRSILKTQRVPVSVISVGNLSVGGTGKTPLVVALVECLRSRGLRPGVLARGYGRAPGAVLNDEGRLLAGRFPDLPQVQMPDRVAGAQELVARGGVDVIVMDDGFQHRRLHRDLDLVCLDCTRPWFRDHPLPGGLLREWPGALRRADLVVLTRSGALDPPTLERFVDRARDDSGGSPVLVTEHEPLDVVAPDGSSLPLSVLAGRPLLLCAGIGRPGAFRETVASLGARVVGERFSADHAPWDEAHLAELARLREDTGAEWVLCTEKDLVRGAPFPFPIHALRINLQIKVGAEHLERALAGLGEVR